MLQADDAVAEAATSVAAMRIFEITFIWLLLGLQY